MMKISLGLDAVNIDRAKRLSDHFVQSFFHPSEVQKASECKNPHRRAEYLASRFAAKEAFAKALGTGIFGLKLNEIEVCSLPSGQPSLSLHGKAKADFDRDFPGAVINISLTHEAPLALAVVQIFQEGTSDEQN